MRKMKFVFAVVPAVILTGSMAYAQLAINSPLSQWSPNPTGSGYVASGPGYVTGQPGEAPAGVVTTDPNANTTVIIQQPGATAMPYSNPPVVAAPANPNTPAVVAPPPSGSAPVTGAGIPSEGNKLSTHSDDSTIVVMQNGTQWRAKTFSDYGAVRTFDTGTGTLALDDGTVVNFPANFAFLNTPEVGQPVAVYYFKDRDGNNVLTAIDNGLVGAGSGGADSGGGR